MTFDRVLLVATRALSCFLQLEVSSNDRYSIAATQAQALSLRDARSTLCRSEALSALAAASCHYPRAIPPPRMFRAALVADGIAQHTRLCSAVGGVVTLVMSHW
jgi:hypothetical protein